MQVAYVVAESPGKGLGVFVQEAVAQHRLLWDVRASRAVVLSEAQAQQLAAQLQASGQLKAALQHMYFDRAGCLIDVRQDDGRFVNHSSRPNSALGAVLTAQGVPGDFQPNCSYALRDIQPGEELLEDYNTYGIGWGGWGRDWGWD